MTTATGELEITAHPLNTDGTGPLMILMTYGDRKLSFKADRVWDVMAGDGFSIRGCPRPEHPAQMQAIFNLFSRGL